MLTLAEAVRNFQIRCGEPIRWPFRRSILSIRWSATPGEAYLKEQEIKAKARLKAAAAKARKLEQIAAKRQEGHGQAAGPRNAEKRLAARRLKPNRNCAPGEPVRPARAR